MPEGLLGSDFTWEDVQNTINKAYDGKVLLGENKKIRPFAVGVGLQSLLGVIEGDWIFSDQSILLPDSVLMKIGSPLAMIEALKEQAEKVPAEFLSILSEEFIKFIPPCHNSEIFFYQQLKSLGVDIDQIPNYYFGNELLPTSDGFTKGCIGIEYVQDVYSMNPTQNFSDSQIKQVLEILAKTEVAFLSLSDEIQNTAPHNGMSGLYQMMKDWFLQMNNQVLSEIPHPAMKQLAESYAQRISNIISTDEIDQIPEKMGMRKILVHGDLWPGNILWKEEKLDKIVDFQMIHFGLAATDLTRLFNSCLSAEDRKMKWKEYLRYFYDCLTESIDGQHQIPYTYEQLELTYQLIYPRTTSYLLPPLVAVLDKVSKMEDCEPKMVALNTLISKIMGMYMDIIEMHDNKPDY